MRARTNRYTAFTLMEALLASVILAMSVAALVLPFSAGAAAAAQDARMTLAVNLAQNLMEEIMSKSFLDPDGSTAGETGRSTWDNMQDYNNYIESEGNLTADGTQATRITDSAGAYLSRQAYVVNAQVGGVAPTNPPTFLNITVEVRYRGGVLVRLTRTVYGNQ